MIILETPSQIKAFQIIATIHGLHMEIDMKEKYGTPPTALPTRGRALATARQLLNHSGHLTRKQALKLMEEKYPQFAKKSTAVRREA